jgi:hypothetical protein
MILGLFKVQLRLALAIFAVTALAALRPAGSGCYFNLERFLLILNRWGIPTGAIL